MAAKTKTKPIKIHHCGVPGCETAFTRGGLASPDDPTKARCPMHYHRERRGSVLADDAGKRVAKVRREAWLPPDVDAQLQALADETSTPPAEVIRQAVVAFIAAAEARSRRS